MIDDLMILIDWYPDYFLLFTSVAKVFLLYWSLIWSVDGCIALPTCLLFWGIPWYKCDGSPSQPDVHILIYENKSQLTQYFFFCLFYFYRWESAVLPWASSLWSKGIKLVFSWKVGWNYWLDNISFQWLVALVRATFFIDFRRFIVPHLLFMGVLLFS